MRRTDLAGSSELSTNDLLGLRDAILPITSELGAWAQARSDDNYLGRGGVEVGFKSSPKDLVTSADLEVQRRLVTALGALAEGFGFMGEEEGLASYDTEVPLWVIDPIDGTHNFVRNYPGFCIVVTLVHRGEVVLAVVFDAATGLTYSAVRGGGAWRHARGVEGLGHERISVSDKTDFAGAMVSTGFTDKTSTDPKTLATFNKLVALSAGLRVSGSAARDAGFVAAGKSDLYWQAGIRPWDVAPSLCLVREAGGAVELRFEGDDWLSATAIEIFSGTKDLVVAGLALG
ncbi:MAG: inositol monophosphatase [Trueperaceae bacterium]|nr:inositol monophosphatase [Trueperaceae bacterium]